MRTTLIVLASLVATPAFAANLLINGDIETNASGQFGAIGNWGPNGGWAPHVGFERPGYEALGSSFGFMSAGTTETVGQKAGATFLPAVQYTFSGTAWPGGNTVGEIVFQIGYDEGGAFQHLATQAYNIDNVAAWTTLPGVSYTPGAAGPELGKTIWVRLGDGEPGAPGNDDIWFDNLVLTPEPASLVLLSLAAAGLLRRR